MDQASTLFSTRTPPHDNEAELSVLGAMLFDKDGVSTAAEMLTEDDFYRPDNRLIFKACVSLFSNNISVDLITLKDKLIEMGHFDNVGGLKYLSEIASSVYTSAHVKNHAHIVEQKALQRRLIKIAGDIATQSYESQERVDDIIAFAEKEIFSLIENRKTEDFVHLREILVESFNKIERAFLNNEKITGVQTGFIDFDFKTSGLQPSDLILIAARPSMGKTAFALNIAQTAAIKNHIPTIIFSLEMSREQLAHRLLCQESRLDSQRIRNGDLVMDDFVNISRAMATLSQSPLYIDDTPGINIMELRSKCRKLKLEKNLGLIMIDYLQLMSGTESAGGSRQQEISQISRSLKAIAREMNTPVIALSQLSRACEARADKRPMLSDLRESGAIEQDADVVAFLYRDEYYFPESEKKNIAEVIIAKQRNGPTGTVELYWRGECTKFENLEQ